LINMGRICITIPDNVEERITKEAEQSGIKVSAWVAQGLEQYLIIRDRKPDQDCDQVRQEVQQLRISTAVLEEKAKGQVAVIEELRTRAVHAEGVVQQLMSERQVLLPARTGFWSRLFGKG